MSVLAWAGFGCSSTGSRPDGAAGSGGGGRIEENNGGRNGQGGTPGIGGGVDGGSQDGSADAHSDASQDTSHDGGPVCAGAVAQGACTSEGTVCSNGCTDVCQFCNLLRCTGGHWQTEEAAPAPCFACGPSLRCQTNAQYCYSVAGGAVTRPPSYECRTTPATCLPVPSCTCLRNQNLATTVCTDSTGDAGSGQITTTELVP